MDERSKILNNIIHITDSDNNQIDIQNISLEFSCNKYSSKKNNIYHIVLNGKHLAKKDTFKIKYKCCTCENDHIVGVTQFLRKINKCSFRCNLCCNNDETKKLNHSRFMTLIEGDVKGLGKTTQNIQTRKNPRELYEKSVKEFEDYDDSFKAKYFENHLTEDDFKRISKNIVSLQNGTYDMQSGNLEYWSIFKTNNQMLFSSVFYDTKNDIIVKANQPIMKCENCGDIWRAKMIERYKNYHKIMCNSCTFCNKTFKLRTTKNIINDVITYQSKLELKFIRWCNENNLILTNGPTIQYPFNGKICKYRVDFLIEDLEFLIEIKDNHIWHRNQVASGKWQQKEDAVIQEIKKGNYKEFIIITPKNWLFNLKRLRELRELRELRKVKITK